MKLFPRLACLLVVSSLLVPVLGAQNRGPAKSPPQTLTQVVGTTAVTVDYGRPGIKGREIYGGLVPFGKVWRTGANASTKLKLAGDAKIGGLAVPAGEYALYTIPGEAEWTVIISRQADLWGAGGYDAEQDLGRFTVVPEKLEDRVETFTIGFSHFQDYAATMYLDWDLTRVAFTIETSPAE
jgi:hypothetical protein